MYDDEEPTTEIPKETMHEARERSTPAHMVQNYCDDGFTPIGPDRPTRDIRLPAAPVEAPHEVTAVDGIPVPIDVDSEDTEPLLRFAS